MNVYPESADTARSLEPSLEDMLTDCAYTDNTVHPVTPFPDSPLARHYRRQLTGWTKSVLPLVLGTVDEVSTLCLASTDHCTDNRTSGLNTNRTRDCSEYGSISFALFDASRLSETPVLASLLGHPSHSLAAFQWK